MMGDPAHTILIKKYTFHREINTFQILNYYVSLQVYHLNHILIIARHLHAFHVCNLLSASDWLVCLAHTPLILSQIVSCPQHIS